MGTSARVERTLSVRFRIDAWPRTLFGHVVLTASLVVFVMAISRASPLEPRNLVAGFVVGVLVAGINGFCGWVGCWAELCTDDLVVRTGGPRFYSTTDVAYSCIRD